MPVPGLRLLDAHPGDGVRALGTSWEADVQRSLERDLQGWVADVRAQGLSAARAWVLVGWVEDAATRVVRTRDRRLAATAVSALALAGAGPLDPRDVWVVGQLLHRAAGLAGVRWERAVDAGCSDLGDQGAAARGRLTRVAARLPATHEEHGAGAAFTFRRPPPGFDPVAWERRLSRHAPQDADRAALLARVAGLLRAVQRGHSRG